MKVKFKKLVPSILLLVGLRFLMGVILSLLMLTVIKSGAVFQVTFYLFEGVFILAFIRFIQIFPFKNFISFFLSSIACLIFSSLTTFAYFFFVFFKHVSLLEYLLIYQILSILVLTVLAICIIIIKWNLRTRNLIMSLATLICLRILSGVLLSLLNILKLFKLSTMFNNFFYFTDGVFLIGFLVFILTVHYKNLRIAILSSFACLSVSALATLSYFDFVFPAREEHLQTIMLYYIISSIVFAVISGMVFNMKSKKMKHELGVQGSK